jgi:trk system potassium uptake protein TrkA
VDLKNIVIVGGGLVGQTLAQKLAAGGHDVTLVESDPVKIRDLSETLDVHVIEGNGATAPVLRAAGVEEASLVVASTDSDECNVVVGLLAVQLFRVPGVVVRVRDPGHQEAFSLVSREYAGEHVCVNTDAASVDRIATLLEVRGAIDVVSFMDGELLVAGFRIGSGSDFAGLRVSDMKLLFATTPTLAVAILRGGTWLIPHGQEEIHAGDLVYFAIVRDSLEDVLSLVGVPGDARDRVMIAGATSIGMELAQRLQRRGLQVMLIEQEERRASRAADVLGHALVIHGRVTDQSILEDEEIENVSSFVAVTEDHETNLVAGLLAKRLGAGRAYVLVDNPALVAMVGEIGIDAIISPRSVTIGLALQHIRGSGVRSGASLLGDQIEIVEVEAARGSRLTSAPLMDVKLPRGVLVGALRREGRLLLPQGADRVEPGDRALLITTNDLAPKLAEYLGGD